MRNRKNSFSKYQATILTSIILVATIVVLVWGIIPAIKNLRILYTNVNNLRAQTKQLQNKLTSLNSLNLDELKKDLVELLIGVPFGRSVATILATILDVASQSQVNLDELTINAASKVSTASGDLQSFSTEIPVNVTLSGDSQSIRMFLEKIQNVRRILRITSIDVIFTEDGSLLADLVINGFSLPMLAGGIATDSAMLPLTGEERSFINRVTNMPKFGTDLAQTPVKPPEVKQDPFMQF